MQSPVPTAPLCFEKPEHHGLGFWMKKPRPSTQWSSRNMGGEGAGWKVGGYEQPRGSALGGKPRA